MNKFESFRAVCCQISQSLKIKLVWLQVLENFLFNIFIFLLPKELWLMRVFMLGRHNWSIRFSQLILFDILDFSLETFFEKN